jgi:hypothetical protein
MLKSAIRGLGHFLLWGALVAPALANRCHICGTVVNKTTGRPSAGDQVLLIDLSSDMREISRTSSDTAGHFHFQTLSGNVPHLVRVIHDGIRYESAISETDQPLDVVVLDRTMIPDSIKTSVHAMRIEAEGVGLRVTEMLTLVNSSNPPKTVQKQQLFWLALPKDATVLSSAAQGPETDTFDHVAVPAPAEGRSYFNLPLRPGTTKIQLQYRVNSGVLTLTPHLPFPAETFGVVLPTSMSFESSPVAGYVKDSDQHGDLAEVIHELPAGNAASFTISAAAGLASASSANQSDSLARILRLADGFRVKNPDNKSAIPEAWPSEFPVLWILSVVFGVLLVATGFVYRRRQRRTQTPATAKSAKRTVGSIKEELFHLETARIHNQLSKGRYAKSRAMREKRLGTASHSV